MTPRNHRSSGLSFLLRRHLDLRDRVPHSSLNSEVNGGKGTRFISPLTKMMEATLRAHVGFSLGHFDEMEKYVLLIAVLRVDNSNVLAQTCLEIDMTYQA